MALVRFQKKGVSIWISYVLLTALAVSLGIMVLRFSRGTAEETVTEVVERGDIITQCQQTGIDVRGICQDAQTLYMNITNVNDFKIEELILRTFSIYNEPGSGGINVTILPQKTKQVDIIKQGISTQVEIIPVVKKGGKRIICQSRKVVVDGIAVC